MTGIPVIIGALGTVSKDFPDNMKYSLALKSCGEHAFLFKKI